MAIKMNGAYFNGLDDDAGLQRALDNIPGSVTTDYILFNLNVASGESADINYGWTGPPLVKDGTVQTAVGKRLSPIVSKGVSQGQCQRIWLTIGSSVDPKCPEKTSTFTNIQTIFKTGGALQATLIANFAALVGALAKDAGGRTIGFDMDYEESVDDFPALIAKLTLLLYSNVPKCPITFCPFTSPSDWIRALQLVNQSGVQPVVGFNLQVYSGGCRNDPRQWVSAVKAAQGTGILNPDNFIWPIVSNSPDAKPVYTPSQVTQKLQGWNSQGASLWDTASLAKPPNTLTDYSKAIAAGI